MPTYLRSLLKLSSSPESSNYEANVRHISVLSLMGPSYAWETAGTCKYPVGVSDGFSDS